MKRHKIKKEQPETSSYTRNHDEHDLAHYIHDRVELMHQVFSCLKYKEIKAMAPECVRNLAVGDLQELCTEELLGISSKRLLATLDGAEPPSDTESSSGSPTPDPMETISLDSISSDEEILSQSSKKKKHKHRRTSKTKKKRDKAKAAEEVPETSKASRAGLTVLELLELQARARAIRAQLQNEQVKKQSEVALELDTNTDDEVEIKEEAPDVVEISSGDEKPDLTKLQLAAQKSPKSKEPDIPKETLKTQEFTTKSKEPLKQNVPQQPKEPENTNKDIENPIKTITRKSSDLIITVPQAKATRKIKLNRNKVTVTVPNVTGNTEVEHRIVTIENKPTDNIPKDVDKSKKKQKKNKKKKSLQKEGSDHDEITLQLSDSEKMDLLEDLNEKNYDKLSSSTSDSESSSSDSETDTTQNAQSPTKATVVDNKIDDSNKSNSEITKTEKDSNKTEPKELDGKVQNPVLENLPVVSISETQADKSGSIKTSTQEDLNLKKNTDDKIITENTFENQEIYKENNNTDNTEVLCTTQISEPEIEIQIEKLTNVSIADDKNELVVEKSLSKDCANVKDVTETQEVSESNIILKDTSSKEEETEKIVELTAKEEETEKIGELTVIDNIPAKESEDTPTNQQKPVEIVNQETESESNSNKAKEREISEGELSDRESSEVEAVDIQPEVVCISDDEKQSSKKKKKKDKKVKKNKKAKKSKQDFRESGDQNFYKETDMLPIEPNCVDIATNKEVTLTEQTDDVTTDNIPIDLTDDDNDVYEILELSDDSSCYEVEGTVLSKEPTAEEIEALSARIDEINREDVAIDEEINCESTAVENDNSGQTNPEDESETNISWKDRYLDSKKVKRVLTTANILNALRKKNKELKRKMDEAKKKEKQVVEEKENAEKEVSKEHCEEDKVVEKVLEEGSIEHYQTLQGISKNINPVMEHVDKETDIVTEEIKKDNAEVVTKEMKKDAKQLLKMFRRLLNNRKIKRREKKKKRKQKKYGDGEVSETVNPM